MWNTIGRWAIKLALYALEHRTVVEQVIAEVAKAKGQ